MQKSVHQMQNWCFGFGSEIAGYAQHIAPGLVDTVV
jgi:hypothetical protein